jgi:hypothetical protein
MVKQLTVQDVLNRWEFYTLDADACYHRREYKSASKKFCHTVELLEPWLDKENKELPKVMRMFVLSCHNAAHSLAKQGKEKEAEYYYSHAHFRLLSLLGHRKPSNRLIEIAMIELKSTFLHLKRYLLGRKKQELADNIREESVRVVRQFYLEYVDDVFAA